MIFQLNVLIFSMHGHFVFDSANSMPEVRESAGLAFSTLYKVLSSFT